MSQIDYSTPEGLMHVRQDAESGVPIDAITAACLRADAVLHLLITQFEGNTGGRLADYVITNALWDVQGAICQIKALSHYGYSSERKQEVIHG